MPHASAKIGRLSSGMKVAVTADMRSLIKRASLVVLPISLVIVSNLASASRAWACSLPIPGLVNQRRILPADGATGVPTNVHMVLTYESTSSGLNDHPRLQTAGGDEVPVTVSVMSNSGFGPTYSVAYSVVPTAALLPNTTYQLLSDFSQVPCAQNGTVAAGISSTPWCFPVIDGGLSLLDGGATGSVVISHFTTGSLADQAPPSFPGELTYNAGPRQTCTSGACCGPYDVILITLQWTPATDDGSAPYYELSNATGIVLTPILLSSATLPTGTPLTLSGSMVCAPGNAPPMGLGGSFAGANGAYSLVAIDGAGNRSQPITTKIVVDCSVTPDAGTDGAISTDASPDVTAKTDLVTSSGGTGAGGATSLGTGGAGGSGGATASGVGGDGGGGSTSLGTSGAGGMGGSVPTSSTGAGGGPGLGGAGGTAPDPSLAGSEGCSCRVGGRLGSNPTLALAGLGLLLALKGRRRRD